MARHVREAPGGVTQTIYLDYQATTPLAPEVGAAMRPWIETNFGNPHSPHRLGREAAAAIEVARDRVKSALGEVEGRLYFTSGATEAANWALKGAAARLPDGRRKIVTLATEHACVLDTVGWLATQGIETEILPVGDDGLVDLDLVREQVREDTGIVAAMLVNNEIGVVQPAAEIGRIARESGALFFCDAVQGFGRVPIPLDDCDIVAVSAHKVHGPKGIGALWKREGVEIDPLLHGGGQEGGQRSGTLSPALCVGFGEAARLLAERRESDRTHVERLWNRSIAMLPGWTLNGSAEHRYRGNLNLRREGVDSARLISELRAVAFSAGSACASGSGRPSHVLAALGLTGAEARSSIRLGFGRYTAEEELIDALTLIDSLALLQIVETA
ncbi:cysteine desulfurase family protein [Allosphingosinicella sp.]|jgi:cysteine desulfurase|uniref:cysteine desulfurase family protein n=1 Tax=Allosphingosinicella sp. TaxID=2823234 RepID=UPI003D73D599